jgi:hypothetical protein
MLNELIDETVGFSVCIIAHSQKWSAAVLRPPIEPNLCKYKSAHLPCSTGAKAIAFDTAAIYGSIRLAPTLGSVEVTFIGSPLGPVLGSLSDTKQNLTGWTDLLGLTGGVAAACRNRCAVLFVFIRVPHMTAAFGERFAQPFFGTFH